jgi:acetyl esterase/lipase
VSGGADVVMTDGVQYAEALVGGSNPTLRPLFLDIYRPADSSPGDRPPAVVVIHGGGFERRDRKDEPIVAICERLAAEGFVALSIDYRLRGDQPVVSDRVGPIDQGGGPESLMNAVVAATDDAIAALDYADSHADELGIDPSRIGVVGSSAGAITADHVAYVAPAHGIDVVDVRFVGSLWGGVLLGPPAGVDGPSAAQMTAQSPPLWSIHGDADPTVPFQLDDELVARAAELGVAHQFYRVAGGTHGYGGTGFFTADLGGGETPLDRLVAFARSHSD